MTTPKPSTIIHTMRELRRQQVRMSYMDAAAINYIMDNELMEEKLWPCTTLLITDAGLEFIRENEE
jgi:hypothetical protein